jgi:hypothetical protein
LSILRHLEYSVHSPVTSGSCALEVHLVGERGQHLVELTRIQTDLVRELLPRNHVERPASVELRDQFFTLRRVDAVRFPTLDQLILKL